MANGKVAQALREALRLMNDTGKHWMKGDLRQPLAEEEYAYCSLGAIYQVTGIDVAEVTRLEGEGLYEEMSKIIQEQGDPQLRLDLIEALAGAIRASDQDRTLASSSSINNPYIITAWNDLHFRQWSEVVEMFEIAATASELEDG